MVQIYVGFSVCLSLCPSYCLSLPLPQASAQALDSYRKKESMDLHDHQIKTNELKFRNHKRTNKQMNLSSETTKEQTNQKISPDSCLVSLYEFCTSCVLNPLRKKAESNFCFISSFVQAEEARGKSPLLSAFEARPRALQTCQKACDRPKAWQ